VQQIVDVKDTMVKFWYFVESRDPRLQPGHNDHDQTRARRRVFALAAATAEMIRTHESGTLLHVVHRHLAEAHTFVAAERYRNADA
jgi:hypothetical protein